MNIKQRKTLLAVAAVIGFSIIVWLGFGREILTKTQILVEKKDELFPGMVEKQWVNKFLWGLDLTGAISLISLVIGSFFYFYFRDKKTMR